MKPLFTTLALATLAALASTVACHQEEQSWAEYVDSVETTLQETGHCRTVDVQALVMSTATQALLSPCSAGRRLGVKRWNRCGAGVQTS